MGRPFPYTFIGINIMIIRHGMKTELENLARRNNFKFVDVQPGGEYDNVYNVYMRDRDGWVYVWSVAFDDNDQITLANEVMVYDAENAPDAIPAGIVGDVDRLRKWHETMALDPDTDARYYDPA